MLSCAKSLEWESLVSNLGGNNTLGGNYTAGNKLKSKTGWLEEGNGTNQSGFLFQVVHVMILAVLIILATVRFGGLQPNKRLLLV
jgi:hypothetical protein